MKTTLTVDLAGVRLPTPVMVASGCFGTGKELERLVDVRRFGGAVAGSVTLKRVRGLPAPRMAETSGGLLSAVGLQNPGVESFLRDELPVLASFGIPVFASVAGTTLEEYIRVTALLQGAEGIAAVEANVSTPDVERDGAPFACSPERAAEVVGAMSRLSIVPVFAKLSAEASDLVEVAQACVRAGAHGLTLINAVPGMAIDPGTFRPKLGAASGGLSGPAIRPMAVRAVFLVSRAMPEVPILGVGGVRTAEDAVELMLAGAWAVQVGTAVFANPAAPIDVAEGILAYLKEKGLLSPADLRGRVRVREPLPEAASPGG